MSARVVMLSGGVGGAKLVQGMSQIVPAGALTVIVNTGDDFEHLGLWISPDIDSVLYALAGLDDPERGWGRRQETWTFMAALEALGGANWFRLGDGDLAMHIERTRRRAAGERLGAITRQLAAALGIRAEVVPMSDDPVPTRVETDEGVLGFQEYFVNRRCEPRVRAFRFAGAEGAAAHAGALAALADPELRAVVIGPSNPFVSIDPILAVPGLRTALERVRAPVVAVTPIVGGRALKGPAAKMLAELNLPVTGCAVARHYADLIDAFVLDAADAPAPEPPPPGVRLFHTDTIMRDPPARRRVAADVLGIADLLASGGARAQVQYP
jgi:LPPG:FO 2-phospho-L-lactate transferase